MDFDKDYFWFCFALLGYAGWMGYWTGSILFI